MITCVFFITYVNQLQSVSFSESNDAAHDYILINHSLFSHPYESYINLISSFTLIH